MANIDKNKDIQEQYYIVSTETCTPSIPNTVKIVKTVKTNEKPLRCSECLLVVRLFLLVIFFVSTCGFAVMWFTELYNDALLSNLVLSQNSKAIKWWINPPLNPFLRVYIFNYTNSDDYIKGKAEKLIVKELGPYVYQEKLTKVDIVYNENSTITYKEKREYKFMPKLSNGLQTDLVTVPNIPLISMEKKYATMKMYQKPGLRFMVQISMSLFTRLQADPFLWGYDNVIVSMAKTFNMSDVPFDQFGVLINRNGTARDFLTINNGASDITKIGMIMNYNGKTKMNVWPNDSCNAMRGTDGSQFPPHWLDKKMPLEIFIKDLCRSLPLEYLEDVNVFDNVPAMRYIAKDTVFAAPHINPDNHCYCIETERNGRKCPPSGVFNTTVCNFGAPIFVSFPHFLGGEAKLFKKISGLKPDPKKHRTFADIHPRLAFPIDGASRFQVNVAVPKTDLESSFKRFNDDILPVIWFELIPGALSEELRNLIYHSTFSLNALQIALEYGTLIIALLSIGLFAMTFFWCDRRDAGNLSMEKNHKNNNMMMIKKEMGC